MPFGIALVENEGSEHTEGGAGQAQPGDAPAASWRVEYGGGGFGLSLDLGRRGLRFIDERAMQGQLVLAGGRTAYDLGLLVELVGHRTSRLCRVAHAQSPRLRPEGGNVHPPEVRGDPRSRSGVRVLYIDAGEAPPYFPADMAFEFKLPDIGEGVVEGEIVKWLVQPGDAIDVDQPMVEVMTDKATVVIPSPKQGKVLETRGAEGDIVEVHSVIVVIEEGGQAAAAPAPEAAPAPAPAAPAPAAVAPAPAPAAPPPAPIPAGGKVLAAPATRRLAREVGVDISTIAGSGPAGRVTSDDVRAAQGAAAAPAAAAPAAAPRAPRPAPVAPAAAEAVDERIPVRGLRRRIWDSMSQSAFTAAHFTFVEECDCTELVDVRSRFNGQLQEGEPKMNYLPFIAKAVLASLKKFPALNGHVDDDSMEFIQRGAYNLGIAVSSERGLVVPVIKNADRLSLLEMEAEIRRLADAVRNNKLTQADLGGSTFTITSLGREGGIFATPIINYPEVAIMGIHKMAKRPMVVDDQIAIRQMMNLSLSFDHRLVDGHVGAAFTYAVIKLLQSPDRLMMEMA